MQEIMAFKPWTSGLKDPGREEKAPSALSATRNLKLDPLEILPPSLITDADPGKKDGYRPKKEEEYGKTYRTVMQVVSS